MICSRTALIVAALAATPALAQEQEISIDVDGQAVRGVLSLPDGDPAPVVLLLHGFTGTRDELPIAETEEGVFSRTARLLREEGYASLRIDFRGSGVSDGAWAETTFSGQTADALAAIDWLEISGVVDGGRMAVLGWSQGGLIAAQAVDLDPNVDALILWAPATIPRANFSTIVPNDVIEAALLADPGEPMTFDLPWGAETTLNAAFFQEMLVTSTAGALAGYEGPVQVFMGTNDTTITPQPGAGEMLMRYHAGEEELITLEMDHVFNAFTGPQTLDDEMMPEVLRFLDARL